MQVKELQQEGGRGAAILVKSSARSACQGREVGEVRGAGERKIEAVELWQSEKLWKQELRESRNGGWRGVVHWPEIRTLNLEAE